MMLLAIPANEVHQMWGLVEGMIAKATDKTAKLDTDEVRDRAIAGHFQMWVVWCSAKKEAYACIVTDLTDHYNGRKVARIFCLGGVAMRSWLHLISVIEQWARDEGCDAIEAVGRLGWGRMLTDYEAIEHVFSKEL